MILPLENLETRGGEPLYVRLYEAFREEIESGRVKKGEKLPSIRRLSEDSGLSRTTIEGAYQQLCVEGYIKSSPQRGYYVLDAARGSLSAPVAPPVQTADPSEERRVRYHLESGRVDGSSMDLKRWRGYIKDVLGRQELLSSYGDSQGERELREALAVYSHNVRGVQAGAERFVIGAGTQPLLYLLCSLLRERSNVVAMEAPGFKQAEQIFDDCGMRVYYLPSDEEGVRLDALEASRAKALFVNPSNRLKTGESIPMGRRLRLLEWAQKEDALLIEDDYNGELRYNARPIPALQGLTDGSRVVYLGSFSKLLLPSVRISYMVLTPRLLEKYLPQAERYNQTASKIEQLALARSVREGRLERHLRRLRTLYAAKSEKLMECLKSRFGEKIGITLQETALCLVVSVSNGMSGAKLAASAEERGVRVTEMTETTDDGTPQARLGFAGLPFEDIEAAVGELAHAWLPET